MNDTAYHNFSTRGNMDSILNHTQTMNQTTRTNEFVEYTGLCEICWKNSKMILTGKELYAQM